MDSFEAQFKEVLRLHEHNDFPALIKRTIDLTLDTEDINFYRKTNDLLDRTENNPKETDILKIKAKELLDSLYSVLSTKKVNETTQLLEINNLQKKYSNSSFTLGPINLSVSEGEIIGLVGENGNGKTSLLRAICLELEPDFGQINYNFEYKSRYDLRSKLIYIPQRTKDWHGSLLSNLRFTAASYGIEGEENLLLVDLIISRMGLRQYRKFKWANLSSGYKMRFELARMLLRKPKLLLIDEPLANLDIVAQQVVLDDFKNIAKSPFRPLGIILSSQQLYEVEKTSDKVIFLKDGTPQNISIKQDNQVEENKLIIEFESNMKPDALRNIFSAHGIEKFQLKGGTFVAVFPGDMDQNSFLQILIDNQIPVNYFRNISNSTRRFFL